MLEIKAITYLLLEILAVNLFPKRISYSMLNMCTGIQLRYGNIIKRIFMNMTFQHSRNWQECLLTVKQQKIRTSDA